MWFVDMCAFIERHYLKCAVLAGFAWICAGAAVGNLFLMGMGAGWTSLAVGFIAMSRKDDKRAARRYYVKTKSKREDYNE